jgi:hypothetical protein
MAFKNIKGNVRNSLLDYFVSGKAVQYHSNQFGGAALGQGLTATGGVISDYTDGPAVYRAHIFTSSGTFSVSALGTFGSNVEYLVVAGGGGGGGALQAGGGGAGGLRTNLTGHPLAGSSFPVSTSPGSYSVTIGGGGAGGPGSYPTPPGFRGVPSSFGPITSTGGGGGAQYDLPGEHPEGPGGSGGGSSSKNGALNGGAGNTPPASPPQGNSGGASTPYYSGLFFGGGGGGAGAAGTPDNETTYPGTAGNGGAGVQVAIAGPTSPTFTGVGALNPEPGQYQWFAGGGAGGGYNTPTVRSGGAGGGGPSSPAINNPGDPGTYATGGGGGGVTGYNTYPAGGGNGGSGIVVVRYQIAQLTATAKATGGAISFFGGKTIHTFTSSGTFASLPTWSPSTSVEYVVVAGGGAAGQTTGGWGGGGGGAGGYRTGTTPFSGPFSFAVSVGAGGAYQIIASPNPGSNNRQGSSGVNSSAAFPTGTITSAGGGGGGKTESPSTPTHTAGTAGGSGGGGSGQGGPGAGNSPPTSPAQGNPGGSGGDGITSYTAGGGGGGAGGSGTNAGPASGGAGGVGVQVPATFQNPIVAPSDTTNPVSSQRGGGLGTPGPGGSYYLAGGGGGAHNNNPGGPGGAGGGGKGGGPADGSSIAAVDGVQSTGGGGGGIGSPSQTRAGGGGSGIVLIAYPS